jgi:5-amino-6-(5-phosphoribosylamino)uracil reductase
VPERPYVLVSCAMSADGYIDDRGPSRLVLSGEEDLDRVDEVRAGCDAIMVGAATIRRDDPRLVIGSAERRARRAAGGLADSPVKVTVTRTGDLPRAAAFFTAGPAPRLVYCARPALARARAQLSGLAEVIDAGDAPSPAQVLNDLYERSVTRLLVEGGGQLASSLLTAGLADELHLVVAPFFVGDPGAPRFAGPGPYPNGPGRRMRLAETRPVGDVVLLRYLPATQYPPGGRQHRAAQYGEAGRPGGTAQPGGAARYEAQPWPGPEVLRGAQPWHGPEGQQGAEPWRGLEPARGAETRGPGSGAGQEPQPMPDPRTEHIRWLRETIKRLSADEQPGGPPGRAADVDAYWLRQAIELARRCPPSATAFSVGAVIVAADGTPLATGFSRERDLRDHAEEVALAKLRPDDPRLAGATIYSSLEPCGVRASRPRPCADLIISAGIPRVVYAWHEPPLLATGGGAEMLRAAGVSVTEMPELAAEAQEMNAHLISR